MKPYLLLLLLFGSFPTYATDKSKLIAKVAAREKLLLETTLFYFPDGEMPDEQFDAVIATMTVLSRLSEFVVECLREYLLEPNSTLADWQPVRLLWMRTLNVLTAETLRSMAKSHDKLKAMGLSNEIWESRAPFTKRAIIGALLGECTETLQ